MSNKEDQKIHCRFRVDRDLCIAISACIVQEPDIYFLDDDAKAMIKPLESNGLSEIAREDHLNSDGWVEVLASPKGYNRILESAKICPVLAIIVELKEGDSWKRIYPED